MKNTTILKPLDLGAQLDELRILQDGWLEGEGLAPSCSGLDWLFVTFERNYPDDFPPPHLFPTEKGGVQAEWSFGPNEVTFEVDLDTQVGEWHVLNVNSDDVTERTLNCNDDADWQWLVDQIRAMTAGDV